MSNLREEFEQWARKEYSLDTGKLVHGAYRSFATAAAWEAWQACYDQHSVENYYKGIMRKAKKAQEEVTLKAEEKRNEKE